jgi:anti-sigma factor ChrR (cupin superfamily)
MNSMHPSKALLKAYNKGHLDDMMMLLLSSHLRSCSRCLQHNEELDNIAASAMMQRVEEDVMPWSNPAQIINAITALPVIHQHESIAGVRLNWQDIDFQLPIGFKALVNQMQPWTLVKKKIWQGDVVMPHTDYEVTFKRYEPATTWTKYPFSGAWSLILAGGVRVKRKRFFTGGMLCLNEPATMTTVSEQGCLMLSVVYPQLLQQHELVWSQHVENMNIK